MKELKKAVKEQLKKQGLNNHKITKLLNSMYFGGKINYESDYLQINFKIEEKKQKLMLGDEPVSIKFKKANSELYTHETIIYCKGQSVTLKEWTKFYENYINFFNSNIVCLNINFSLGKFILNYDDTTGEFHIEPDCKNGISGISMYQLESINNKLNQL